MNRKLFAFCILGLGAIACGDESYTGEIATGKFVRALKPVANSYLVVLQTGAEADSILEDFQGVEVVNRFESALNGLHLRMSEGEALAMADREDVKFVEEDGYVDLQATQSPATWGLDRVDARSGLDNSYTYNADGSGVHAYIIDTGINASHTDFAGRIGNGYDAIDNDNTPNDCNGHGTHVAGTVGGSVYGVAKNVTLHAVRVIGCGPSAPIATIVAGVNWTTQNHQKPAVANLSLGGATSSALDQAISGLINAGVTAVVAAGNNNSNACNFSPARVSNAITVASIAQGDRKAGTSNWGSCVDLFAPGDRVVSASHNNNSGTRTLSGTSMASPHVAGIAALYLQGATGASPAQVTNVILDAATPNVVSNRRGSPNLLAYSLLGSSGGGGNGGGGNGGGNGGGGNGGGFSPDNPAPGCNSSHYIRCGNRCFTADQAATEPLCN